jgi:hypothetical protein
LVRKPGPRVRSPPVAGGRSAVWRRGQRGGLITRRTRVRLLPQLNFAGNGPASAKQRARPGSNQGPFGLRPNALPLSYVPTTRRIIPRCPSGRVPAFEPGFEPGFQCVRHAHWYAVFPGPTS